MQARIFFDDWRVKSDSGENLQLTSQVHIVGVI